jgi:ABC-2 type transport system permease protein
MNIKKELLPVTTFARIDIKRLFRDKVAIFFVFIFPIMFLLIFGSIFSGDNEVRFKVAVINESTSQFSKEFVDQLNKNDVFNVNKEVTSLDEAKERMSRSSLDATIVLPANFGNQKGQLPGGEAVIIYDQNSAQAARTLTSVMESIFAEINAKLVATETPFTVRAESTATKGLSQFDYTFAGLLGFTLLSLGIFGPTSVFPRLKQKGVIRRYHTTTLKVWQYFMGNVISNGFNGILAVALMFVVALTVFDLNMRGDYISLLILVLLGAALMFGIGLAIGGWAKNENQAAPLAQLVAIPMMFLSGVFFPVFLMPQFLQTITQFFPLTPIIDGFRMIIAEGMTITEIGPQIVIICIWLVIVYFLAFKLFRWE